MTPHYARGKKDAIAFVFSCPGRLERECGHPAAGTTGRNLEQLLRLIAKRRPDPSLTRADITIANAWDKVEFEGETCVFRASWTSSSAPLTPCSAPHSASFFGHPVENSQQPMDC